MKKLITFLLLSLSFILVGCNENDDEIINVQSHTEGLYLLSEGGQHLIIIDNHSPCIMTAHDSSVSFDALTDGDMIRIKNSLILYSYPGKTTVYEVEKLADGERNDIDSGVLEELSSLGWTVAPPSEKSDNEVTVIQNNGGLDINTVQIESANVRCRVFPYNDQYQMYFIRGTSLDVQIVDMYEGTIVHAETLFSDAPADSLPMSISYNDGYVTITHFTVTDQNTEMLNYAFTISETNGTFAISPIESEVYPVHDTRHISSDGKYTAYKTTDDGKGHGGIDVLMNDGTVKRVLTDIALDDRQQNGRFAGISDVAHYALVGFIDDTAFVYNVGGWEHHRGYGIYDLEIGKTVFYQNGDFIAHGIYDNKIIVEKRVPYGDGTAGESLWLADKSGERILIASQSGTSENQTGYALGDSFPYFFENGVWLDVNTTDGKTRLSVISNDFSEILAEIEYPAGDVMFYLNENLRASTDSLTIVLLKTE